MMIPTKFIAFVALATISMGTVQAYVHVSRLNLIQYVQEMEKFGAKLEQQSGEEPTMRQLIQSYGSQERFEPSRFMEDAEKNFIPNYLYQTLDESKFNCLDHYKNPQYIYEIAEIADSRTENITREFAEYAHDAERRIAAHCLRVLSANDWAGVEQLLDHENDRKRAEIVQTFLADESFPRDPKNFGDDFYQKLADRVDATASELQIDTADVLYALNRMRWFVDGFLVNLGRPLPVDKFNRRVRNIYDANIIWRHLSHREERFLKDLHRFFGDMPDDEKKLIVGVANAITDWYEFDLPAEVYEFATKNNVEEHEVMSKLKKFCSPADEKSKTLMRLVRQGLLENVGSSWFIEWKMGNVCRQALKL